MTTPPARKARARKATKQTAKAKAPSSRTKAGKSEAAPTADELAAAAAIEQAAAEQAAQHPVVVAFNQIATVLNASKNLRGSDGEELAAGAVGVLIGQALPTVGGFIEQSLGLR